MGLHTGTPHVDGDEYYGVDVHRAARIAAAGHGGQVLVSASTAALLGTEGLRDLGDHRLKDLSGSERIYQLGDEHHPPLKSLYRTNLPIPATQFLGRERELGEIVALLSRGDVRLLTLTGPGGTGKTRLALQAAADTAERHPDGVYWVPLEALRDPDLVVETAAQALGAEAGLAEHVANRSMLVVFDNVEQVVEAASDLSGLLDSCPNLQLLTTSRELLRVPGEQAYPVPPLDPEDGAALFVARARAALPSFAPSDAVAELCARLDNLPLALELAAARVRILSPEQLLERLAQRLDLLRAGRGVDPRRQTLRATIEWSYDLLDEEEQWLCARLSVLAGGCTIETAEAVCDADPDTLESLVDKSLVHTRGGSRFFMLGTIREYAAERLAESGEAAAIGERHASYFLDLAEELARGSGPDALEQLELEHDNLRVALDFLAGAGRDEVVLRLAGALAEFWHEGGHVMEGLQRLESALGATPEPTEVRARALTGAAQLAYRSGDPSKARSSAEQALVLHRGIGDERGAATTLNVLSLAAVAEEDFESAQTFAEKCLAIYRELGDDIEIVAATRALAFTHASRGELDRARALHEANLDRARTLGVKDLEAATLGSLAMLAADERRVDDAVELTRANLRAARETGMLHTTAQSLCRAARVLGVLLGRPEDAARLLACFEGLQEQIGVSAFWVAKMNEQTAAAIRSELAEPALAAAAEQGRALTLDQAVAAALDALDEVAAPA